MHPLTYEYIVYNGPRDSAKNISFIRVLVSEAYVCEHSGLVSLDSVAITPKVTVWPKP
jgi:hypothetical protein